MPCEDGKLLCKNGNFIGDKLHLLSYAVVDLFNCIYISVLPLISARTHLLRMCIYSLQSFPKSQFCLYCFPDQLWSVCLVIFYKFRHLYNIPVQSKRLEWEIFYYYLSLLFCDVFPFWKYSPRMYINIFKLGSSFWIPEISLMEIWMLA